MNKIIKACAMLMFGSSTLFGQTALRFNYTAPSFYNGRDSILKVIKSYDSDTSEGGNLNDFVRWSEFASNRLVTDGSSGSDMFQTAAKAYFSYAKGLSTLCSGTSGYTGNWNCIGPFNSYYGDYDQQGRVDCIWVDPVDTNHILVGSNAGGLWESNSGGLHWHNISDASNGLIPGTMGIQSFAVNPLNKNIIYVSMSTTGAAHTGGPYNLGLAYTMDHGLHWYYDSSFISATGTTAYGTGIIKVAYMPGTQKLFAILNGYVDNIVQPYVMYKADTTSGWDNVAYSYASDLYSDTFQVSDMEFSKATSGKVIIPAFTNSGILKLEIFNTSTLSWTSYTLSAPSGYFTGRLWYKIHGSSTDSILKFTTTADLSISGGDTAFMLLSVLQSSDTSNQSILVTKPLSSSPLTLVSNVSSIGSLQFIEVSPSNSNIIYANVHDNSNNFMMSTNGGTSFSYLPTYSHADGRFINIYSSTNTSNGINDVVYGCTDGGISKKRYGSSNFISITGDSLAITQFYGVDNTEANENMVVGGAQDNGGFVYDKTTPPYWGIFAPLSDGYYVKIAKNGSSTAVVENDYPYMATNVLSPSWNFGDPYDDCVRGIRGWEFNDCNNIFRTLLFDNNNNFYLGQKQVWEEAPGDANYHRAFHADPLEGLVPTKVRDLVISETDTNKVYIAFHDIAYADPTGSPTNVHAKLFYSTNARNSSPTWNNITPSPVGYFRINDIETDPNNINRIWLAYGDISYGNINTPLDSMSIRVYYSDDHGIDWHDVSHGLPNLPINKILYQHGSKDILYAATDVGVFRCDFSSFDSSQVDGIRGGNTSVNWTCFNNGLPACIVNDMEFNYCSNKLRIATLGRGMWETAIDDGTKHYPTPGFAKTINAGGVTTWAQDQWLDGSILITGNSTLAISSSTIHMPKNARIAVDKGSKLIVDNSTITNDCQSCFWQGIEAWGDSTKQQNATNQATVIIKNNSYILNANVGVANWDLTDSPTRAQACGGIIQCTQSNFIDNHMAGWFNPYQNKSPLSSHMPLRDQSFFAECTFSIDGNYKGGTGYPFAEHLYLKGVDGIGIMGCNFRNGLQYGRGIRAINAGFSVSNYIPLGMLCSPTSSVTCGKRSTFDGFNNGVDIEGILDNAGPTASVENAIFDTCTIGVYVSAYDNVSTYGNTFNIGNGPNEYQVTGGGPCYENIGIYEKQSKGFHIEFNTFQGWDTSIATYGTLIQSSFPDNEYNDPATVPPNYVNHNSFDSLTYACYGLDKNVVAYVEPGIEYAGLEFLCNTYTHNKWDIYSGTTNTTNPTFFIGDQGSGLLATGNVFASPPGKIKNESPSEIGYYYNNGTAPPVATGSIYFDTGVHNDCSSYNPDMANGAHTTSLLSTSGYSTTLTNFLNNHFYWSSANVSLLARLDGGSTSAMKTYIDTRTANDTTVLFDTLVYCSPYLSPTILKEVGKRTALPYAKYLTVLEDNPEMLRHQDLLDYIHNSITIPITQNDIDTLVVKSENSTARSATDDSIRYYSLQTSKYYSLLLINDGLDTGFAYPFVDTNATAAQIDTTRVFFYRDSLPYVLNTLTGLWTKYELAGFYYRKGDLSSAATSIDDIGSGFSLTSSETTEYDNFKTLWAILDTLAIHSKDINGLDSTSLAEIDTLSDPLSAFSLVGPLSGNIIAADKIGSFPGGPISGPPPAPISAPCPYDFSPKPARHIQPQQQTIPKSGLNVVRAYPNPARSLVNFDYYFGNTKGTVYLEITDMVGSLITRYVFANTQGQVAWSTDGVPDGIYIYRVHDASNVVSVGKISIVK